jgi:hypothetical protein
MPLSLVYHLFSYPPHTSFPTPAVFTIIVIGVRVVSIHSKIVAHIVPYSCGSLFDVGIYSNIAVGIIVDDIDIILFRFKVYLISAVDYSLGGITAYIISKLSHILTSLSFMYRAV